MHQIQKRQDLWQRPLKNQAAIQYETIKEYPLKKQQTEGPPKPKKINGKCIWELSEGWYNDNDGCVWLFLGQHDKNDEHASRLKL